MLHIFSLVSYHVHLCYAKVSKNHSSAWDLMFFFEVVTIFVFSLAPFYFTTTYSITIFPPSFFVLYFAHIKLLCVSIYSHAN